MIVLTDTTLRDGSHSVSHRYSVDDAAAITSGLSQAGVRVIEVSHGDGLGGSSFNYGFSTTAELDLIEAAVDNAGDAAIAVLLLPGIGTRAELKQARERGARVARIATHCTEADISLQHLALARDLDYEVVGFLMMSHMVDRGVLVKQAELMCNGGAQTVYVVDSAGALVPRQAAERVAALRDKLPESCQVGFHAHDNLGCAVANTLAAIDAGATRVDGSCAGLGAGAGNLATELFAAVADVAGIETDLDVAALADIAEDLVRPITPNPPSRNRAALMLGWSGVYSSFLLHAERAAEQFDLPVAKILRELGRRRVVGGQEDMILDVAAELAASRS